MVAEDKERLINKICKSWVRQFVSELIRNARRDVIRDSGIKRVKTEQLFTNLVRMDSGQLISSS